MRFEEYVRLRNEGVIAALSGGAGKVGKIIKKGIESAKQYGRGVGDRWKQSEKGWEEFQKMKKKMKRESFEE